MEKMDLFNYYSLDEVIDRKLVMSTLKKLKKDGKIDFSLEGEIVKIDDLDLDDFEIEDILNLFDENDVFPYLERDDDENDDDEFYDDFDNEEDEY